MNAQECVVNSHRREKSFWQSEFLSAPLWLSLRVIDLQDRDPSQAGHITTPVEG